MCNRFKPNNTGPSDSETYGWIGGYCVAKFAYDFLNNIREVPFTSMSSQAEILIASDVYNHVQRLSLAYHLSRETGKVIRIVSRGS